MNELKDRLEDLKDDIIFFYEDYKQWVLGGVFLLVAALMAFAVLNNNSGTTTAEGDEDFSQIRQQQENAMYYFSLLDVSDMGVEGESVIMMDVFLKRPLQSEENITQAYNDLVEVIKYKYTTNDNLLKGVRIEVYDRMVQYEEGVEPVGLVMYTPNRDTSIAVVHGEEANLEGITIDYIETMWTAAQTIPAEEIDYELYSTIVNYDSNADVDKPLTDEEFQFYLKMNRYMVMTGGWEEGIRKYLEWELGVVEDLVSTDMVEQGYMDFINRVADKGIKFNYYEQYEWALKSEMLIRNPKWVYYLETGEYTTSDLEALKGVVQEDEEYLEILVTNTMEQEEMDAVKEDLTNSLDKIINDGAESEDDEQIDGVLTELQDALDSGEATFEESEGMPGDLSDPMDGENSESEEDVINDSEDEESEE